MRKMLIGIQYFENMIKDGYVYVDKTERIHQLVTPGKFYFLSRPRRFWKSPLISTLEALWILFKLMGFYTQAEYHTSDGRQIICLGINFDKETRNIDEVLVG